MERPVTSTNTDETSNKKFISYLRGAIEHLESSDGFELPSELYSNIDKKIALLSPIKSVAKRTFTDSDRLEVVIESGKELSAGWITNDKLEETNDSKVSKVSIDLHQLYARPKVTQRIIEDMSIKIEDFIQEKIITQMAAAENYSFINGDGECKPLGILSYGLSFKGPEEQKIEAIKIEKSKGIESPQILIDLMDRLPAQYLSKAAWIMSRSTASKLKLLRDEINKKFVWQCSVIQNMPDTIFGYPVIITDDMPKISSEKPSVPILFANLYEGYQIAEKKNISLLRDPYNSKPFVEFYATKRIGGSVVNFNAIKALYCA